MDKHEYEINQLINPKKDIVKSNSKHRDKIETLIQGRRVEGIDGGGETPKKTHLLLANPLPTANQCLIADYDVDNKTLSLGSNIEGNNMLVVTLDGEVLTTQGPPPLTQANNFKTRAELNGYEVVFTSVWAIEKTEGESIDNWSEAIFLEG